MVEPDQALAGRAQEMPVPERHAVLGTPLKPPFPAATTEIAEAGSFYYAEDYHQQYLAKNARDIVGSVEPA